MAGGELSPLLMLKRQSAEEIHGNYWILKGGSRKKREIDVSTECLS